MANQTVMGSSPVWSRMLGISNIADFCYFLRGLHTCFSLSSPGFNLGIPENFSLDVVEIY